MKQSEKVWILELIEKHQKSQDSHLKFFRRDRASAESWKEDEKDQHMVEFCEDGARRHLQALRAQQDIIKELALLGEFRVVKFQEEILLFDQVSKSRAGLFVKEDKFRTGHERLMCTRDRI